MSFERTGWLLLLAGAWSPALAAQEAPATGTVTAEQAIARAQATYSVAEPKAPQCPAAMPGEIVVCRRLEDPASQHVKSSSELAAENGETVRDGKPRPPDLFGIPPGSVVARGCFLPPCPPPPAYMVDFDALPEPVTTPVLTAEPAGRSED